MVDDVKVEEVYTFTPNRPPGEDASQDEWAAGPVHKAQNPSFDVFGRAIGMHKEQSQSDEVFGRAIGVHKAQNQSDDVFGRAIGMASGNQTHFIDIPYASAIASGKTPPVKVEISLAMGNPGPLGLYGFAMTTFMLSFLNANVSEKAYIWWVAPYALCYGGAIQLIAGLLEFFKKNTLAGVAFSSYGGFWIGFGIYLLTLGGGVVPLESSAATKTGHAIYMAYWGLFSLTMFAASFRTNRTLQATFFFVACTFFCLLGGVYDPKSEKAGGVFGIIGAFFAFYTGTAALLKDVYGFAVLPVGEYKPPKDKK